MQVAVDDLGIELPDIELPEPMTDMDDGPAPLVSSSMELADAISALRDRKRYTNGGGE
jgi:hypothetical protein